LRVYDIAYIDDLLSHLAPQDHTHHITERNMGQSLYLFSGNAGFCCWGLGKGLPFPHVKAWGGTAQITKQGHRGTFFRVVFRYLAIAALSFFGLFD